MDAITRVPMPVNEPVHDYAPNSPERARLRSELAALAANPIDLPHVIGGRHRMGDGERIDVVQPHRHALRLGTLTNASHADGPGKLALMDGTNVIETPIARLIQYKPSGGATGTSPYLGFGVTGASIIVQLNDAPVIMADQTP